MAAETHDTIQTLVMRWTGPPHEAHMPAAQLRLERLLAAVNWRPPELPPSAILLIQRLDGLPPVHTNDLFALEWETQLHERIAMLARAAARPRYGPVPRDAQSLLFETPADLLVSLTRDLLSAPHAALPWYWQQTTGVIPATVMPGERLSALWVRHATFLPAALAHLPLAENIRAAVLLSEPDARAVLSALLEAFALVPPPGLFVPHSYAGEPIDDGGNPGVVMQESRAEIRPARADLAGVTGEMASQAAPPWSNWLPPLPPRITPAAQALLGWCAGLHLAPAAARSPDFTRKITRWLAQEQSAERRVPAESPRVMPSHLEATVTSLEIIDPAWENPWGAAPVADHVMTGWGGILFLIHLLRWLNLPEAWEPALSGWAALEAVALALLGPSAPGAMDDPIWRVLAALDGRSLDTPLGAQVHTTEVFRLPPDWLRQAAPAARWHVTAAQGTRRIIDRDRGFLVAEVPMRHPLRAADIEREITLYRAAGLEIEWAPGDPASEDLEGSMLGNNGFPECRVAPAARAWLRRAGGFLRWLCCAALGDPALTPEAAAELIVRQAGTLAVSDTHIDLFLPMSAANVRLRRAGLDHDPGWVPALGHIILFHFVE